jgi:hypothetical protein
LFVLFPNKADIRCESLDIGRVYLTDGGHVRQIAAVPISGKIVVAQFDLTQFAQG